MLASSLCALHRTADERVKARASLSQLLRSCTFSSWRKGAATLTAADAADVPWLAADRPVCDDEPPDLADRSRPSELADGYGAGAAKKPVFLTPAPASYLPDPRTSLDYLEYRVVRQSTLGTE